MSAATRRSPGIFTRLLQRFAPLADGALLLAAIGLVWVAIGLHLWTEHTAAIAGARTDGTNLARAVAESTVRGTGREIDQTLRYVRALHRRDGNALDLRPWVDSTDSSHGLALQLSTTDRNGIVQISNLRLATDRIDLSDRPHFRHFADHPVDELYISAPVVGRVSNRASIQFVRMLTTPAGAFDGIVVLSVDPDYLIQFYRSVDVGPGGRVTLTGLDGVVRADAGVDRPTIGMHSDSPAIMRATSQTEGDFEWTDPADGMSRITHFSRVAGSPLVVEVGMSVVGYTAGFRRDLRAGLLGGTLLTLLVSGIGWVAGRHKRRETQARQILDGALQNISQGLIMTDPQGDIAVMNRRARELLDIPGQIQVGDGFRALLTGLMARGEYESGAPADVLRHVREDARPDLGLPEFYTRTRPDGTVLEVRAEVLADQSVVRTFTDITAPQQAQAALTAARDAAEAGFRARAQFLAVMSHEIRTPLNGVIGVADLLRTTKLSDEQDGYVRIIKESGRHLLDLVNDVLDFSRIEQGAIELESIPFAPAEAVGDVVAMFGTAAEERGLCLSVVTEPGVPEQVTGDPHRFRQVLLNLIGNAVKFTERGGVEVRLFADRDMGTSGCWRLRCAVRDTGLGMSPEATRLLFQEFTQIDGSITRRFGGTGLGLAISRRLVEAMHGGIQVETDRDLGSTFTFDVLVGEAAPVTAKPAKVTVPLPPLNVLLVEDNKVNRIVGQAMLEKLGARVSLAENGQQALERLGEGGFDLIVMDVMMPGMDGLTATRAIRALPGESHAVPVLGLTANAFRGDIDACFAAGMSGFLSKPVTLDRLREAIADVLHLTGDTRTDPGDQPSPSQAESLASLAETLGEETVAAMVSAFTTSLPGELAALRTRRESGDLPGVAGIAHALAGSAATLGCAELATAARELERAARRHEATILGPFLDRAEGLADQALTALKGRSPVLAA